LRAASLTFVNSPKTETASVRVQLSGEPLALCRSDRSRNDQASSTFYPIGARESPLGQTRGMQSNSQSCPSFRYQRSQRFTTTGSRDQLPGHSFAPPMVSSEAATQSIMRPTVRSRGLPLSSCITVSSEESAAYSEVTPECSKASSLRSDTRTKLLSVNATNLSSNTAYSARLWTSTLPCSAEA